MSSEAQPFPQLQTMRRARSIGDTIRVASVPSSHVYVRNIAPVHDDRDHSRVRRLPDPNPDGSSGSAQSKWWPPVMLSSAWVRENPEFDIFHIQFGFDACSTRRLADIADVLRQQGKPLVYTVHDLRNPHHEDRTQHDAQLDVLINSADALITLTPGAAFEIRTRWSRDAVVIPHPHVVDFETMNRIQHRRSTEPRDGREFRVGMHVKSLRACMDPLVLLPALIRAVQTIPGGVLQVNGHSDVLHPEGKRFDESLAAVLSSAPDCVEVRIHDYFSDAELWDYLSGIDVTVLPYRFGTHSGWLEACRDLGTAVIAPRCGYYGQQGQVESFTMDEEHVDEDSVVTAVENTFQQQPATAISVLDRQSQRDRVADAHAAVYRRLLGI